jgi:hypothetical protein
MKQTAVEWLEEQMDNLLMNGYAFNSVQAIELYKQAKEMEKQQIVEAILITESKYYEVKFFPNDYAIKKANEYLTKNYK